MKLAFGIQSDFAEEQIVVSLFLCFFYKISILKERVVVCLSLYIEYKKAYEQGFSDIHVFQAHMNQLENGSEYHIAPCKGLHLFVQAMISFLGDSER